MVEGIISDVSGDDTVMDEADVTVSVDVSALPPEDALAIARQNNFAEQDAWIIGELMKGEDVTDELQPVEFHLPIGAGLTALSQVGAIEIPQQPPSEGEDELTE